MSTLARLLDAVRRLFAAKGEAAAHTPHAAPDLIEPGNRERREVMRAARAFRRSPVDSRRTPRPTIVRTHRHA